MSFKKNLPSAQSVWIFIHPKNFRETRLAFRRAVFRWHVCKATTKNRLLSPWWLQHSFFFEPLVVTKAVHFTLSSSIKSKPVRTFFYNYSTGISLPPCPLVSEINSLHSIYCCKFLLSVRWRDQVGGWHCLVWEVFCWLHSNRLLETGVDGVAISNRCCSANNVGQCKHEPRLWAPAFNWTSVCIFPWLSPV